LDDEVAEARAEVRRGSGRRRPPERNFFFMIKQLTLIGYYTSQIGFEQELRSEIIPARHAACVPQDEEAAK
jgi:glucoside 3-dehydrogenase (cytochrome c) hitch-hiker subunit